MQRVLAVGAVPEDELWLQSMPVKLVWPKT